MILVHQHQSSKVASDSETIAPGACSTGSHGVQEHDFNETPRRSGVPVVHPSQSPFSPQQGTAAAQKHDQAHRGAMDNGKGKQPPTARRQLVVRTVVRRRGPCIVCAVGGEFASLYLFFTYCLCIHIQWHNVKLPGGCLLTVISCYATHI